MITIVKVRLPQNILNCFPDDAHPSVKSGDSQSHLTYSFANLFCLSDLCKTNTALHRQSIKGIVDFFEVGLGGTCPVSVFPIVNDSQHTLSLEEQI